MKHAITIVNYQNYQSSEKNKELYGKANWYNCKQKRLVKFVGKGGTLWLETSAKNKKFDKDALVEGKDNEVSRHYSLAYKLTNCRPLKYIDKEK